MVRLDPTMDAPILATKLYVPPLPADAVVRSRLLERLDAAADRRLVLVCAPAGFGKTTLVRAWLATRDEPIAWVSLDGADADPHRFLAHVVGAVRAAVPAAGEAAARQLASPSPPDPEVVLAGLLNELTSLDVPLSLVLDDVHAVESPAVDEAATFLLERLPARVRVIATTRQDPAWPLGRWRVRGQVLELRAADLRFTADEAAAFFARAEDVAISDDDVAALAARTEGWAAGLRLAALSLRGRADGAAFVRDFAGDHRFVVDYLVDEVLRRQPPLVRRFLLRTSVLERLCGPLCDAVTGDEGGGERLVELERKGLFLVPLDDRRAWYRYHQLFADVLRAHAQRETGVSLAELHARASTWCEVEGLAVEAVRHALASGNVDRAGDLIVRVGPGLRQRYQDALLVGWLRQLPEAHVRSRAPLVVAFARALMGVGAWAEAGARLEDAERALAGVSGDALRAQRAAVATARAFHAQGAGDLEAVQRHAGAALADLPPDDVFERATVAALLGLAAWSRGDLEAALGAFGGSMARMAEAGFRQVASTGTFVVADLLLESGRLRDAEALYARAYDEARDHPEEVVVGAPNLALGLAEVALARGDLAGFDRWWAVAEADPGARIPGTLARWHRLRALRCERDGHLEDAHAALGMAERHREADALPEPRPLAAVRARLWLRRGDFAEAEDSAAGTGFEPNAPTTYLRAFELATWARLRLARHALNGDVAAADEVASRLTALVRDASEHGWTAAALDARLALARAHEVRGDLAAARAAFDQALALAEPEGWVDPFVREGAGLADLLADASARRVRPAFVARLHHGPASVAAPDARTTEAAGGPPAHADVEPLLEPLTDRELEVLRLLAEGLSNAAIGRRTFRALPTIKGYNRSLFAKLQARNRTEAVARARALGLL